MEFDPCGYCAPNKKRGQRSELWKSFATFVHSVGDMSLRSVVLAQ